MDDDPVVGSKRSRRPSSRLADVVLLDDMDEYNDDVPNDTVRRVSSRGPGPAGAAAAAAQAAAQDGQPRLTQRRSGVAKQSSMTRFLQPTPEGQEGIKAQGNGTAAAASGPPGPSTEDHNLPPRHDGPFSQRSFALAPFSAPSPSSGPTSSTGLPPLQSTASDPANQAPLSTPAAGKSAAQQAQLAGTSNGQSGSLVPAGSSQGPAQALTKTPATAGPAAPVADGAPEIEFPATTQRLLGWILDALVREGDTNDKVPMLARNKARKLRGGAHSAVQPLYIGFEEARLRLSVGHYPSIQELYRELESHCAACWVSLEEANQDNPVFDTILRTHLKDIAQQYATEVISLCEEVAESRMGRAARRTDTGAGDTGPRAPRSSRKVVVDEGPPMPPLPGAGQSLPYSVRTNMEPYYQGTWRREPFPPRAYTSLTEYALDGCTPEEHALLRARLATQRPDGASEHFRTEHAAQLGDAMPALERQLAAAVHQRATLTLGVDVMETDAWGIDMYTRRNIFNAVYESGLFNQPCPSQAAQAAAGPSITPQPTTAPAAPPPPEANPLQGLQTELKEETVKLEDSKSDNPSTLPQPPQPPAQPASNLSDPAQQHPSSPPPAPGPPLDPTAAAPLLSPSQPSAALGAIPPATAPAWSPSGCAGPLSPQVRARMAALDRCGWGPGPEPVSGPQFESKPQLSGPLGQANGPSKELTGQGLLRKGHVTDSSQKGDEEGAAGQGSDPDVAAAVHTWIDSKLLPAINHTGLQGYNMLAVCDTVRQEAAASGDPRSAGCADALEARVRQCGWPYFRIHPKGRGIQCTRPGGVRAFTLVEEYLGELHSPWRWWEVQDALRKATGQEDLPDFYNITLERPKDDPAGYDVLYVEAAFKATFASRMSHSCTPNCQAVVVSAGGRLTIAMYALRDIQEGEEMTFDYSSVTESEKEFRSAICLCGTQSCRGSYLHFLGAKAFGLFLETDHTLLHRQSIILRACMEPMTDTDRARLKEHGLGTMALTHGLAGAPPCPEWLHKWASLMLEYVELERHMLPKLMLGLPPPFNQYTQEYAQAQAQGVMSSRITSILVALDKVKLFLRQPSQCQAPPLRLLTDAETIHHLWTGDRSFIKRTVTAAAPYLISGPLLASIGGLCAPDGLCGTEDMQRTLMALSRIPSGSTSSLAALLTLAASQVQSLLDVRSQLLQVEQLLRSCEDGTGMHTAAADIIHMTACTVVWFTAERNYKGFSSPPVVLHEEMLKMHKVLSSSGTSNGNTGGGRPGGAQEDWAEGGEDAEGEEAGLPSRHTMPPRRRSDLPKGDSGSLYKRYGPWFMWSQLSTWYKQTVADPSATLSAERRGTLSLPDIECCYAVRGAQRYTPRERSALLDHIERRPDIQWKTSTLWTFRNEAKVYGSPMLDSVYLPTVQGTPSNLSSVVERLRSVPYGGGAGGEPQRHGPGRPRKDSRDQLMLNK